MSQGVAQQSQVPVQQKAVCCLFKEATNYHSKVLECTDTFLSLGNGLQSQHPTRDLQKYFLVPRKIYLHASENSDH